MKKSLFSAFFALFLITNLMAQTDASQSLGLPQGMKYQAIARDVSGGILANKTVDLQINLGSNGANATTFYAEKHTATTNALGLFDLTIGGGKVVSGKFDQIPWSSEEIWISIRLDAVGKGEYQLVHSSKLLAVPYAFHAGTASEVASHVSAGGSSEACPAGSVTGTLWSTATNCNTTSNAKFGTADYKPLVFTTDYIERMRIAADGNVNINRSLTIGENLTVAGLIRFTNTTPSSNCNDGAMVLAGGLGIGKEVNICGDTRIFSNTAATSEDAALFVDGGATVGSLLVRDGRSGKDDDFNSYPLQVDGADQGIAVRIRGSRDNSNNFITFMDGDGTQGRVEGQTISELHSTDEWNRETTLFALSIAGFIADVAGLVTEVIGCAVQFDFVEMIGVIAQGVSAGLGLAGNIIGFAGYVSDAEGSIGVAYESGSGDYAEWLARENPAQDYIGGEIVGVKGGKISYKTKGADHVMAISTAPIVLGNMPLATLEKNYEKVAFMGQVPVRVIGVAKVGDFVLASGNEDGYAVAVSPNNMKTEDYARIVGVAWEASSGGLSKQINVAVGINTNDMANRLAEQERKSAQMQAQLNQVMAFLKGETKSLDETPAAMVTQNGNVPTAENPAGDQPVYEGDFLEDHRAEIEARMVELKEMLVKDYAIDIESLGEDAKYILDHPVEALKDMNSGKYGLTVSNEFKRMRQENLKIMQEQIKKAKE